MKMIARLLSGLLLALWLQPTLADVRIKELTRIQGVRDYSIIGYGLVVGLAGTGDTGTPDSGVNLGFEVQAVAGELAAAECGYLSRCVPEYYDVTQTDQAA